MTCLQGVLVPVEWDEKGKVTAIALSSNDESEYIIDDKGKGPELFGLIREEVAVQGLLRKKSNVQFITVKKYEQKSKGLV